MNAKRWFIFCLMGLAVLLVQEWRTRPIHHAPGVLVAAEPLQEPVSSREMQVRDFTITRRARFSIRARVLSSESYTFGTEAELSPLDLALGWGPMSDQQVLDELKITQSGRWYRLRWALPPPIPEQEIMRHSGNMHMIPAQRAIAVVLEKARPGNIVSLKGYLVDVDRKDGWHWRTSLSRNDTGPGACEVVWVESAVLE